MKVPLGSDVTSCQLSCYRDPDKFCIDQGEGIAPYDRYQCVSCSDLCPGPNDDPAITSVSLTCIENCKGYLQQPTLNQMYSNQGFLGSSLGLDSVVVCVIGILIVALLFVAFLQHKKIKFKRQMQREVRNSVSGVSYAGSSSQDIASAPPTVTHVTVNQGNHAPGPTERFPPSMRRSQSETDMLLNSAAILERQDRYASLPAGESKEGGTGSTEVLKC